MKYKKAVKIAVEAMKKVAQKYAVDANAVQHGFDNPTNLNAAKIRKDIAEAIAVLEGLPGKIEFISERDTDAVDDLIEIRELL